MGETTQAVEQTMKGFRISCEMKGLSLWIRGGMIGAIKLQSKATAVEGHFSRWQRMGSG